jgi:hypothetical protein
MRLQIVPPHPRAGSGEQLEKLIADGYTFFHVDSEFSEFSCTTCHTGGPQLP